MKVNHTLKSILQYCSALLLGFILFSAFQSCKGPQGDPGPAGSIGPAGVQGATGAAGPQGNANVVYTEWKKPVFDGLFNYSGTTPFLSAKSTAEPIITQEAIDKGLIYVYTKINEVEPIGGLDVKLIEQVAQGSAVTHVFKIPGREGNSYGNISSVKISYSHFAVNYLSIGLTFSTTTGLLGPVPEFSNKTREYFQGLVKDLPQYRIIVVHGNVKSGRMATIDWDNYAEVKQILNLKD